VRNPGPRRAPRCRRTALRADARYRPSYRSPVTGTWVPVTGVPEPGIGTRTEFRYPHGRRNPSRSPDRGSRRNRCRHPRPLQHPPCRRRCHVPAPPHRPADQGEGPPIASEPPFGRAPATRAGATHPGRPRPSQARRDPPGPARPTRTHRGPLDQPGPARTSPDPAAPEPAPLTHLQSPPNRSSGLSRSESAQPHAPNGLGRTGPRRTQPRGGDTHPVRGPGPGGRFPARPGHTGTDQRRRGGPEPSLRWSRGPACQRRTRRPRSHDHANPDGPGRRKPGSRPSHDRVKPPSCTLPGKQLPTPFRALFPAHRPRVHPSPRPLPTPSMRKSVRPTPPREGPPPPPHSRCAQPSFASVPCPHPRPCGSCFRPVPTVARPVAFRSTSRPYAPDLHTRALPSVRHPQHPSPRGRTVSHQFLSESLTRLEALRTLCQQALT
jgi:hypothetical protein